MPLKKYFFNQIVNILNSNFTFKLKQVFRIFFEIFDEKINLKKGMQIIYCLSKF